jgi:site-specific DNA recombinase
MSSDQQEQSVPSQRAELTSYAKKHGYTIVGEYIDEAISGDDTHKRLGFLQMRDDAQSGNFDVVLCWDQDRFGRFDLLDAGYWITPFRQAGVRLETIAQGKIDWEDLVGQLIYSVNQLGKAQFLRDLSRNTVRGMLASAKEGRAGTGGPNPFGYRSKDGEVWIVPEEAEVVRWIFREYLKPGGSLRSVAAQLNERDVKPPRKKGVWRMSSIRAVLSRRKYTGTFVYGARNGGKYFCWRDGEIVPRRKSDKVVDSEPIIIENKFEAIIDQEVFDRAQAKLVSRKPRTSRKKARQYLLSGLVKCGDCGGAMGGIYRASGSVYRCRLYHQTGNTACYCNSMKESPLVSVIVRKIQERYLSKGNLDRLRNALEKEQQRTKSKPRDLSRLQKEIDRLSSKIDKAEDTVLDAPISLRPGLYRKLEGLSEERKRLAADLESLSRHSVSEKDDQAEIDRAIGALSNLGDALEAAKPEDTKELLGSIVTKIELFYDHEETEAGRQTSTFTHGLIYLRPDAGEGWGTDPNSTLMINKGPILGRPSG